MSPGWIGRRPSNSRVSALDAGCSMARMGPRKPKSSAGTEAAGRCRWRPITQAMSRVGTPFVGDCVQCRSRRGPLCREAEHVRGVQHVRRGPAAGPVAGVAGGARVAGDADHAGDEAVLIAVAVHGPGQPRDGRADAACRHAGCRPGRAHGPAS